jgi:dipeptidyl aminopeptidase/acylaminoacyl peptidase
VNKSPGFLSDDLLHTPQWSDKDHLVFYSTSKLKGDQVVSTNDRGPAVYESFPELDSDRRSSSRNIIEALTEPVTVHVISISTGSQRQVATLDQIIGAALSPNGRYLAVAEFISLHKMTYNLDARIHILEIATGIDHIVDERVFLWSANDDMFGWSPDSTRLAYPDLAPPEQTEGGSYKVIRPDDPTHSLTLRIPSPHPAPSQLPIWSRNASLLGVAMRGAIIIWSIPEGRVLHEVELPGLRVKMLAQTPVPADEMVGVATTDSGTKDVLFSVDLATAAAHTLAELSGYEVRSPLGMIVLPNNEGFLLGAWSVDRYTEIVKLDRSGHFTVVSDGDNRPTSQRVQYRDVRWRSSNGEYLTGALLVPESYGQESSSGHLPLIVRVYPTDHNVVSPYRFGLDGDASGRSVDLTLVADGYAVFFPNCPTNPTSFVSDLAGDVFPGVQHLIDLGIADPNRIGTIGFSDGVEASLNLLTSSKQFKASVMMSGFANFITEYGDMTDFGIITLEGPLHQMTGPWKSPEDYIANSPIFRLDRVTAPILQMHGTNDEAVPLYAGEELFTALRRLHKRATLVEYPQAGHDPSTWTFEQQIDAIIRTLDWFDTYVKEAKVSESR